MRRLVLLLVCLLGSTGLAHAQYDTSLEGQTGRVPFGSYFDTGIDSINAFNGNVMLNITLLSRPGRELSSGLSFTYNSKRWQAYGNPSSPVGYYSGGWRQADPVGWPISFYYQLHDCDQSGNGLWSAEGSWQDSQGGVHFYSLGNISGTCEQADPPTGEYWLAPGIEDGSAMVIDSSGVARIIFKDGSVIQDAKFITTNGNYFQSGGAFASPTDTLGRGWSFSTNKPSNSIPSCSTTPPTAQTYTSTYTIADANGVSRTYTLHYEDNHPTWNPIENCYEGLDDWLMSIDLPNGRSYTFEYGVLQGYLTRVTLPSGAVIEYDYYGGNSSNRCFDFVVERRVIPDGTTENRWTYTRSETPPSSCAASSSTERTVTVVSPEGHETKHIFELSTGHETQTEWRDRPGSAPLQIVRTLSWSGDQPTLIETERGAVKRRSSLTWSSPANLDQREDSDWYPVNGSLIKQTRTTYSYLGLPADRPASVELEAWDGSQYVLQGRTEYEYDEYSLASCSCTVPNHETPTGNRRNLTTVRRFKDATNSIEEHFHYDDLGNVVEAVDHLGRSTTFDYTDNFTDNTNRNTFAYLKKAANELDQFATAKYDYNTGLAEEVTDIRNKTTTTAYDLLNRVKTISEPNGRFTEYFFTDSNAPEVREEVTVDTGAVRKSTVYFDRLYRPILAKQSDPEGDIFAETVYDGEGRAVKVSAPYRTGAPVWTETVYDGLGRPVRAVQPDNSVATVDYVDNGVLATDPAGTATWQEYNALGQLTKVKEFLDGAWQETAYQYYVFGPLKQVTQDPQTRTFTYDFLGRLLQEAHPESGTTTYVPDDNPSNGRVETRIDGRSNPITTTYTFDALDRLTKIQYSDGTPTVDYVYDETINQIAFTGLLTGVTVNGVTASVFEYFDNTGLLKKETVTLAGVTTPASFVTEYTYDLDGRLLTAKYPSGRVVSRSYEAAGGVATDRLGRLTDETTAAPLVQGIQENAAGQLAAQRLGNGIQEVLDFNTRQQLTGIAATAGSTPVMDLDYSYGPGNNGRIRSRIDGLQPEHSANYTFDSINRLTAADAANGGWRLAWSLDRWGNRTAQQPYGLANPLGAPNTSYYNNQVQATNWEYDGAGNLTKDNPSTGGHTYQYDAENRLISVDTTAMQFAYDAAGRRIKKTVASPSSTTYYVYGLTGLMSEFTVGSGSAQAAANDRLEYRVAEHTGTGVLLMAPDGTVLENNRVFPFGELWQATVGSDNTQNFTSYQRDAESDKDYAMARYYAFSSGRFMTADKGPMDPSRPASLNRYAYAGIDPINYVDPDGNEYTSYEWVLWGDQHCMYNSEWGYSRACPGMADPVEMAFEDYNWRLQNTYDAIQANADYRVGLCTWEECLARNWTFYEADAGSAGQRLGNLGFRGIATLGADPFGKQTLTGTFSEALIALDLLQNGGGFRCHDGPGMHPEIGPDAIDCRQVDLSGIGSLQVVFNQRTGVFYSDVDLFDANDFPGGTLGHVFGEVLAPRVGRFVARLF